MYIFIFYFFICVIFEEINKCKSWEKKLVKKRMNLLWKDPGIPTDSFYEVRAECTDVPKTKFKIKVSPLLFFLLKD